MNVHIAAAPQRLLDLIAAAETAQPRTGEYPFEEDAPGMVAHMTEFLRAQPGVLEGGRGSTTIRYALECRDHGLSQGATVDLLVEHWGNRCSPPIERYPANTEKQGIEALVANAWASAQNAAGCKTPEAAFHGVNASVFDEPATEPAAKRAMPPPVGYDTPRTGFGPPRSVRYGNAIPPADLKPRDWVLKNLLLRGAVTGLIAPGGFGKSQASLMAAIALARGDSFLTFHNPITTPRRTIIYNAEDSLQEMSMRLYAQCQHDGINPGDVIPYVMLISGKEGSDHKFHITRPDPDNHRNHIFSQADVDALLALCEGFMPDLIIIDPLAKVHLVNESDNSVMVVVMDALDTLARKANAAVLLLHHTAKAAGQSGGIAGNIDASRGASVIKDSARLCFTLSGPSPADVKFKAQQRHRYLRLDDAKNNYGMLSLKPVWLEKHSVRLHTGEQVGAFNLVSAPGVVGKGDGPDGALQPPAGENEELALKALHSAIAARQISQVLGGQGACTIDEWRDAFTALRPGVKDATIRQAFSRGRRGIVEKGYAEVSAAGWVTLHNYSQDDVSEEADE